MGYSMRAITLLLLVSPTLAYYSFINKIPNGANVPHPCKANYMWKGVGHTGADGGGKRNQFGLDFDNAGHRWTEELCRFDSDGDGVSNGDELGDPNCVWTEGSVPERVTDISHPGLCTPYNSAKCVGANKDLSCDIKTFKEVCGHAVNKTEIDTIDLKFDEHEIPNTETNYICQHFDLPDKKDLHVVANEGLIDNRDMVHHILIYGCPDSHEEIPSNNYPSPCSMNGEEDSCNTLISLWTVGLPGVCYTEGLGYRIGLKGFKKVKLEIHYNNPMLKSGQRDKSGFRLYYQPAVPSTQDLATFAVGQTMLEIPPGRPDVEFTGSCPSECTQMLMPKPMYVVSTINHMHYMGRSQWTEIKRGGKVVKTLANDQRYDYDSPVLHEMDEPFQVLPGDEIVTTCSFSSMSKQRTVFYGDGTSDEMCFSFLTIYPADALPYTTWCSSFGPLSTCELFTRTPKMGCDWAQFTNITHPDTAKHYQRVNDDCNMDGTCRAECKKTTEELKGEHPCLQGEMNSVVTRLLGQREKGASFLARLHSCAGHQGEGGDPRPVDCQKDCAKCNGNSHGDGDYTGRATSLPVPHLAAIFVMTLSVVMATGVF